MRVLFAYSYFKAALDISKAVEARLSRLRQHGFLVDGFVLTLDPPGPRIWGSDLDRLWSKGDVKLLNMYEELARHLENYDVLVNYNGINLHPEFVQTLPTYNVYSCFDDPESSEFLSRPVAAAYDLAMVGNIAELDTYRSWGVKNVAWWPNGFHPEDCDTSLTMEKIINGSRDVSLTLLCERSTNWRSSRLEKFTSAFPAGSYYGKGWPSGFLPEKDRIPLLQRTKIGPNFHNSTGPVNSRTYVLPANGVMQICDNKSSLGRIYELDKEAVGFDTIEEAIDLCKYYLAHDQERREIAAAGWERVNKDYNEVAVFNMLIENILKHKIADKKTSTSSTLVVDAIRKRKNKFIVRIFLLRIKNWLEKLRVR